MKNSEYNFFEEVRKTQENINYQAIQYSVVENESYVQKNETMLSEEFDHINTKKTNKVKENNGIVKKLIQKVTEATSSFVGGIAATAIVAVSSIIMFTNIIVKEPIIKLLDLLVESNYVTYNLLIDEVSENMEYYTVISNEYENYRYELVEGENSNTLYNLKLNTEYNLYVIGINNNNEETKYFNTTFTTKSYECNATFNKLGPKDVFIEYSEDTNIISFNTEFNNNGDDRLKYRVILTDPNTSEKYVYDGSEKIAIIEVPNTITNLLISYELYGIYSGVEKIFDKVNITEPINISMISSEIYDLSLIGINKYQLSMIINSDYPEEVINSVNLLITYDDLTTNSIVIKDVLVSEEMNFEVVVPNYCKSFKIDYTIDLLGANGNNSRIITGNKEYSLENSFELVETQVDNQEYSSTRLFFKYHFIDENTTLAVKNVTNGNIVMLEHSQEYVEIELDSSTNLQEYTYYLSYIDGEVLGDESPISFELQEVNGDYNFQYVNPGDAIVTFNEDETINIYLNTIFESEDSTIYYLVRYTNYNDGTIYNIKYTESVAYLEDIPFSDYGIEYFVFKSVDGIEYQLKHVAVSGGIELSLDDVLQYGLALDDYDNPYVYISYYQYYNLSNFVLLVDDTEIPIPSSNIVINDSYCEIDYQLEYIPSKLVIQYEANFNEQTMYETIASQKEIKGEQYKKMYAVIN